MDFLWDAITEWLKELLVGGITSNLSGMFDSVNQKVAEISGQVGMTPQGCCCALLCSKLEASQKVFLQRTKPGGRFLNGLCTSTQRPDQSKNEGHVQSHQEAACLLRERGASRRAAFLSAQRACGDQHSGHVHGHPHAAVFPAGDVREERPAAGKDTPQHDPGVFPAAPTAAL